jgi:hypothetical protein
VTGTVEDTQGNSRPVVTFKHINEQPSDKFKWPISIFTGTSGIKYEVRGIDNNNDGDAVDAEDGFALYKGTENELKPFLAGVENMQILYGIKNHKDSTITYNSTGEVNLARKEEVVSIKLSLFMRTPKRRPDLVGTDDKEFSIASGLSYNPGGENHKFEEGYRHRLFTTTVSVRNPVPNL